MKSRPHDHQDQDDSERAGQEASELHAEISALAPDHPTNDAGGNHHRHVGEKREGEQSAPLPGVETEKLTGRQDLRQCFDGGTVAVVFVHLRDLGHGRVREFPDVHSILARNPLQQDVDLSCRQGHVPSQVPKCGLTIVGPTRRIVAQRVEVDPEGSLEHDLEAARQLWTVGLVQPSGQMPQVQVLRGLFEVAAFGRRAISLHGRAGRAAPVVVLGDIGFFLDRFCLRGGGNLRLWRRFRRWQRFRRWHRFLFWRRALFWRFVLFQRLLLFE
jgi:hypothetical protein